jgi:hypothetical protein
MITALFALLSVLAPDLSVHWTGLTRDVVTVSAQVLREDAEKCLQSGLEARVRFVVRGCRRRTAWFDGCEERVTHVQWIVYDPITESFKVTADTLGDETEPSAVEVPNRTQAVQEFLSFKGLSLNQVMLGSEEQLSRWYFGARAVFVCKGRVSETVAALSTALTLGLIEIGHTDTGWVDFVPEGPQAKELE